MIGELELLVKLGGLAVEFDDARRAALDLQRQRNDAVECTDPGERIRDSGGPIGYTVTDACWRTKRHYSEGEYIGRLGTWCDECKERQRLHEAMHDARARRGALLRRITHWSQVLRLVQPLSSEGE